MEDSQKQMFKEMMVTVCQQYKREVFDLKLLRLWWNALKFYDHNVVSLCFERWLITSEYMPTIADMVKMCRQKNEQRKNQLHNEEMAKLSYSKKAIENKKKFSMFLYGWITYWKIPAFSFGTSRGLTICIIQSR